MKKCLITCATSNLGQHLSQNLAKKCDQLIITGRDRVKLSSITSKANAKPELNVVEGYLDFDEVDSIHAIVKKIDNYLDSVVLIVPTIPAKETSKISDKEWENLFRIIFYRPLLLLESLIPALKNANRAKVVFISGISSVQYLGNYSVNGPIRAAWIAQMKAMAQEYGMYGIHFNTISFGGILTNSFINKVELEAKQANENIDDILKARYSNVPLRKYASMDDVSNCVYSMLSNATDHITGQNIICDGGFIRCY